MTERNLVTVQGSIEFRDAVMKLDVQGYANWIFARRSGTTSPVYRILPRHADYFQKINIYHLFESDIPPIYMDDFATALIEAGDGAPKVDVFTVVLA